jgi:hypothetical protein
MKKSDVAADNHQNKPAVNDPHTGIAAYLETSIKARHILDRRDHNIALAHLVKTGKPQWQGNLDRVSIDGCQSADHSIANIMAFEFV